MGDVVSFRPTREEADEIRRAQRSLGLKTQADAVRYLIRRAAKKAGPLSEDPVWKARAPVEFRGGRSRSSREIDEELYGAQG